MFTILISSCSENPIGVINNGDTISLSLTPEEQSTLKYFDNDYTFPESEARKHALDIASHFNQVEGLHRTIKEVITKNISLSSDPSKYIKKDSTPEYYIFNFNPKGFAIISADERALGELLSSANSTIDDKIHNGYKIMMERAIGWILNKRTIFNEERDSILKTQVCRTAQDKIRNWQKAKQQASTPTLSKIGNYLKSAFDFFNLNAMAQSAYDQLRSQFPSWVTITPVGVQYVTTQNILNSKTTQGGPLLTTNFRQEFPYNSGMPNLSCPLPSTHGFALAGCVQIAYAQILLYFNTKATQNKVSNLIALYPIHYPDTTNPTTDSRYSETMRTSIGSLCRQIYDAQTSNKYYGCEATGIYNPLHDDIINTNWGFKNSSFEGLNQDKITSSVQGGSPVFLAGVSSYNGGHAWVVDGVRTEQVTYKVTTSAYTQFRVSFGFTTSTGIPEYSSTVISNVVNIKVHNNWGWGESNGNPKIYRNSEWATKDIYMPDSTSVRFQYNMTMIPFIKSI